jgi:hypothetical protein
MMKSRSPYASASRDPLEPTCPRGVVESEDKARGIMALRAWIGVWTWHVGISQRGSLLALFPKPRFVIYH